MKKLLSLISLTVTLTLTADNFNESFYKQLVDGNFNTADSILTVWSRQSPEDPELFPARFNLLLNVARSEKIVLSDESSRQGEQWVLTDSAGNEAGYMFGETTWNDSLVNQAFVTIDRGISSQPDRIDFRLGKAAAATITRHWSVAIKALDDMLDRNTENGGHWLGSDNTPVADAGTLLAEALYDRISEIFESGQPEAIEHSCNLASRCAGCFGDNSKIINLAGAINLTLGNDTVALKYFEKALLINPDDAIPLGNMAYLYYKRGDTDAALEIYRSIENGNYEDDDKQNASQMIADITAPVENMQKYYYFFHYLPEIASIIQTPAEYLDVELINTRIPAYNKLRSPFADSDITVEEISVGDNDRHVIVWTFPMPDEMPLCRFIAFVADGNNGRRVYTLEKSIPLDNGDGNYWIVGTTDGENHGNFGDIPLPSDAQDFVKALRGKKLIE